MKWRFCIERILVGTLLPLLFLVLFAAQRPAVWKYAWFPPFFWGLVAVVAALALAFLILNRIDTGAGE